MALTPRVFTSALALWAALGLAVALPVRSLLTWAAQPVWWHYFVFGLLWLVPCVPIARRARRRAAALIGGAFLAALSVGFAFPWNSHDRFLRDLAKLRSGMTSAEVGAVMAGYMTGSGWTGAPSGARINIAGGGSYASARAEDGSLAIQGCEIYRHSDEGAWDSDWGIVCFQSDRVTTIEFSPD